MTFLWHVFDVLLVKNDIFIIIFDTIYFLKSISLIKCFCRLKNEACNKCFFCVYINPNLEKISRNLLLACPMLKPMRHYNSKSSSPIANYTFTTAEVKIPFLHNYHQELLFVLAPKGQYQPHIDPVENSKALGNNAEVSIKWERKEFGVTKSVSLLIDSSYLVILRAFGKALDTNGNVAENGKFGTIDCVQRYGTQSLLTTRIWRCDNGDTILAEDVCDTVSQCSDDSDEASRLCKGEQTRFLQILTHLIYTILFVGFLAYILKCILSYFSKNDMYPIVDPNQQNVRPKSKKIFIATRTACYNAKSDGNDSKLMMPGDIEELQTIYKDCHEEGPEHGLIVMQTVKDFSLVEENQDPCANFVDNIVAMEDEIHLGSEKESRFQCLYNTLNFDLEVAQYIVNTIERHGFFSGIQQSIVGVFKRILGRSFPETVYTLSITFTLLLALQKIVVSHLDVVLDANIFAALNHTMSYFVGDEEKHVKISKLPLNAISYVYMFSSFASQLGIYLLYLASVRKFFNVGEFWYHKTVVITSAIFPSHFMQLELTRCLLMHTRMTNELRKHITTAMKENADMEIACEKYIQLRQNIKENLDHLLSIRRPVLCLLILKFILENLTQVEITVSFILSEMINEDGNLMYIVSNTLVNLLGVNLSTLCSFMVLIQINTLSTMVLTIKSRHQFLLSHGILGSIMLLVEGGLMVGTKVILITMLFSNSAFVYPILTILEFLVALAYFKMTKIQIKLLESVLPCAISPSLLLLENNDCRRFLSKESFEILSSVSLHFLNLVLSYAPVYAIIQHSGYFDQYKSIHDTRYHAGVVAFYCLVILPYVAMRYLYNNFGTPWRQLNVVSVSKEGQNNVGDVTTEAEKKEKEGTLMPCVSHLDDSGKKNRIDVVTNRSFLDQNIPEVRQKLKDLNKSTDT